MHDLVIQVSKVSYWARKQSTKTYVHKFASVTDFKLHSWTLSRKVECMIKRVLPFASLFIGHLKLEWVKYHWLGALSQNSVQQCFYCTNVSHIWT